MGERHDWLVHTPNLLREALENNPTAWTLVQPMNILRRLLAELAERAIQLDDPELNILMLRLSLYEVPPLETLDAIRAQSARITTPSPRPQHGRGAE